MAQLLRSLPKIIEDNMTRWKTSDEFPGSISLPFGIKTSHTWHEIGQILRIINDLDITTFVELGTHVGGLASMISCVGKYKYFRYYGLDIKTDWADSDVLPLLLERDVLSESTKQEIEMLPRIGRTMIYCDGGNKITEMDFYASILISGDVIACHDYYNGQDVVDLDNFGVDDTCSCVPEVREKDLVLFENWERLPNYLLKGTRITGYIR